MKAKLKQSKTSFKLLKREWNNLIIHIIVKERKTYKGHKIKFFDKKVLAPNWPRLERPNFAKIFINL